MANNQERTKKYEYTMLVNDQPVSFGTTIYDIAAGIPIPLGMG